MPEQFLHGIETIEVQDGARPVETIKSSVIGLIGTAPDADPANWPLNTNILINGERGIPAGLVGAGGELGDMLDAIMDQASATVLVRRVEAGVNPAATMANIIGDRTLATGLHGFRAAASVLGIKPKMLIAPGYTSQRPADGVSAIVVSDGGEDYTEAPAVTLAAGEDGVVPTGFAAHARVVGGEVVEVVIDNPGMGGTAPVNVVFTGGGGGEGAVATATLGAVGNPVVAEMLGVAQRLRAMICADGPNTNKAAAATYRGDWDSDRLLIVDPHVKVFKGAQTVVQPASARVVGLQAQLDKTQGFWWSPSNQVLNGVIGTARPIDWDYSDADTEANYLNEQNVATVIRDYKGGGYKLWGNRVASSDTLKQFWAVRRTHDMIIESIEIASLTYVDRPLSPQLLLDIAETVNAYLRSLKRRGAIIGGRAWVDPSLNPPAQLALGVLSVSYDAEGPAPLERLVFMFNRNTGYYQELTEQAAREIARLAA